MGGSVAGSTGRPAGEDLATLESGLDALERPDQIRVKSLRRVLRHRLLPPFLTAIVILALWQGYVSLAQVRSSAFPSPEDTWYALATQWGPSHIPRGAWNSVYRAFTGFAAAVTIGTPVGLLTGSIPFLRSALLPFLSGIQSLPSVVSFPAAVLWFGVSPGALYFVILFSAVPSIAVGLVAGLDQIPPHLLLAGRNLGARGLRSAWHVRLPAALPGYVAGLKQGWAFGWRSLMAAELIAVSPALGPGLGQILDRARRHSDLPGMFATTAVILVVGVVVDLAVFAPLERRLRKVYGRSPG